MATALRSRDEIEAQYRWDTASIYRDDPSWEADFRAVEDRLPLVVALQGTLGLSGQALLAALRQRDEVGVLVERLLLYAILKIRRGSTARSPWKRAFRLRRPSSHPRSSR
jgi:oligoendopeptidase F